MFRSSKASLWFEDGRVIGGRSTREDRIKEAGDILLDHLTVNPQRLSRLVDISFTSPDPALSKQIVDTWGQVFIQITLQRRYEATSYARHFLDDRLAQLRTRIEQSERMLVDYAGREGIVNLPASTPVPGEGAGANERPLIADDLATLNRELARATRRFASSPKAGWARRAARSPRRSRTTRSRACVRVAPSWRPIMRG